MNFNRHIHPEMICDLRGNIQARAYYRDVLSRVYPRGKGPGTYSVFENGIETTATETEYKPAYTFDPNLIKEVNADVNMLDHWAMCRRFLDERPPVYHLSRDFAQALTTIDKEIPIDILPEKFFCYLSFPEMAIQDDTGWVQGAYVSIGKGSECNMAAELRDETILSISYLGFPRLGQLDFEVTRMVVDLRRETISKLMSSVETVDVPDRLLHRTKALLDPTKRVAVEKAIINALIYIHSQDPEIDSLRPTRNLSKGSKRALIASGGHTNDCMLPVQLLNWSYLKPRERHVDETIVKAHPRWQRCGPQLSQVTWILVESFVRRYKATDTSPQE